jgi:flagellin
MALTVNHNAASGRAQSNVRSTQRSLSESFSRISSGLRITKAADDAAGLAMSENMDADTRSLRQAHRNANDGISVVQTAEGATNEVADMLKRMRELAVQSASETLDSTSRGYANEEFTSLRTEIDRVANITEFNGIKLGDGSQATINVQVGIDATANSQIQITTGDLNIASGALSLDTNDVSTTTKAKTALTALDTALDSVSGYRSAYGAVQNRLESALNNLETYTENLASATSNIRDADFAHETAEMSKFQIMQQAGIAVLGQANGLNAGALRLIG